MMSEPLDTERPEAPIVPIEVVPADAEQPATPPKSATRKAQETAMNLYRILRMIVLVVLGFIVALFVVRNWNDTEFDYVFGNSSQPLALIMLLFTAIGILVGMLLYWFIFRKDD